MIQNTVSGYIHSMESRSKKQHKYNANRLLIRAAYCIF